MRVVAFTGMPGAGKSEAVAVARGRGLPVIRMGEFVWEETRRRGLDLVDANVGRVATELRRTDGMDVWAQRTCDAILRDHTADALVVVDGVRNREEVDAFRRRLGDRFELVAVTAKTDERVHRLLRRGRPDDPKAPEEALRRDERELGWGIGESIAQADHAVVNDGDLGALRRAVESLLDRLMRGAGSDAPDLTR